MMFWKAVFWISLFVIFYTYVFYPLIMRLLARGKKFEHDQFDTMGEIPGVTVIVPAYNEELVIEEKLQSTLKNIVDRRYLEVIVGSDNSTDRTNEIVKEWTEKHDWVKLVEFKERTGKVEILNQLVPIAKHNILILSDSNVMFKDNLILKLVRHFKDKSIGLVGANFINRGLRKDGISEQETQYIQSENKLKFNEGLVFGTMMGAFGGCYAVRKELVPIVPRNFIVDDFFITLSVIDQGYKAINDLEASCYEDVSNNIWEEYRRKVRIGTGNWQNLWHFKKWMLQPWSAKWFTFKSHKLLRWIGPAFFLLLFVSSCWLVSIPFYKYAFIIQSVVILLIVIDFLLKGIGLHVKPLRALSHFVLMNIALVMGFFKFLLGVRTNIWRPTKRNV